MLGLKWYDYLFFPVTVTKGLVNLVRGEKKPEPGRVPQMSAYGRSRSLVYGKTRITGNVVYWEYFSKVSANDTARIMLGLCEGPITGVARVWRDKEVKAAPGGWGWSILTGTRPTQTAWSRLPAGKDIGYPGLALAVAEPSIVRASGFGQCSFEVKGLLHATGDATNGDAHPADILGGTVASPGSSMLLHTEFGAGFLYTVVTDTGRDGNAASSYRRYTTAEGLWISPAFTAPRSAAQCLQEILDSTNATCLWSSGVLEIVPLGDQSVTGSSVTYTPVTTVQYAFKKSDIIPDGSGKRVRMTLPLEADAFNLAPVEFYDRAPAAAATDTGHAYNVSIVADPDPIDVFTRRGERKAPVVQLHAICQRAVALKIARTRAQRMVKARAKFEFTVGWRFARLEPLDFVSFDDEELGFTAKVVRIRKIKERASNGNLTIEAYEWPIGTGAVVAHTVSSSDGPAPSVTYDAEERIHQVAAATWSQRTSLPATCSRVATNGTRLVAVGSGVCMYSDDHGETWTAGSIPAGSYLDVKWCPTLSVWVAVGASVSATSTDGITFSAVTLTGTFNAIIDTGTAVGAVGASVAATLAGSPLTWTSQTIGAGTYNAAAWSGTAAVAIGNNVLATSDANLATWTTQTPPTLNGQVVACVWAAGVGSFLAVGQSGTAGAMTAATGTPDGITWTAQSTGMTSLEFTAHGIDWDGVLFVAATTGRVAAPAGPSGFIGVTRDGVTWRWVRPSSSSAYAGMTWTGRRFVNVGSGSYAWLAGDILLVP